MSKDESDLEILSKGIMSTGLPKPKKVIIHNLPTNEELNEILDKPNNGILMVELNSMEAIELQEYLETLTFGDLIEAKPYVPSALHKVYEALACNKIMRKGI